MSTKTINIKLAKTEIPRNPIAVAMAARYGKTTSVMKDRRAPRGGTRNKQAEYRAGNY